MSASTALESRIDQVTIYRRGAVVTRAAPLPAGISGDVQIEGLPLSLDDGSVRAKIAAGNGDAGASPQATDVRVELCLPPLGAPIEPPSEAELREVRDRISRLEWELGQHDQESATFDRLALALPERLEEEPPRPVHASVWREVAGWAQRAKDKRAGLQVGLREELRQARERLARLERQAAEARAERGVDEEALSKRAVIRLSGEGASPATLLLEYRVPGAAWRPSYVLRVARDGASAQLGVRALVTQRSGEPWERVKLSASTADLLRGVTLPELKSIRIGRSQPDPERRAWREPPKGAEALFEDVDRAMASAPPSAPIGGAVAAGEPMPQAAPEPPPPPPSPAPSPRQSRRDRKRSAPRPKAEMMRKEMAPPEDAPAEMEETLMMDMALSDDSYDEITEERSFEAPPAAMAPQGASAPMKKMRAHASKNMLSSLAGAVSAAFVEEEDGDEIWEANAYDGFGAGSAPQPGTYGGGGAAVIAHQVTLQTTINYSELQLVTWDADEGERGQLRPRTWRDQLPPLSSAQLDRVGAAMYEASARAEQTGDFASETCDVASSSGAFDYRYDAVAPVDVPSDDEVHNVPLLGAKAEVEMTLVVVPRESDQAVRVASLTNPLRAPILEGPADIYLEQEFLVASRLETVPAGAELQVGLGVEEALKVARNTHYREEAQGLLRGGTALLHEVEIEVASRLPTPVKVEVRERVPIKDEDDKEILVEEGKVTPPWEEWEQTTDNPLKGGRRWRFELPPGEKKPLRYSYEVHIDAKQELVGGNRRERG